MERLRLREWSSLPRVTGQSEAQNSATGSVDRDPTSDLPGSQVFLGGPQARIQQALLRGYSAVRHAGVLAGTAASSSRTVWHQPQAGICQRERSPSAWEVGLDGAGGRAWCRGRRRLEWPKETHFLSIFRNSKHSSTVKLLKIKTFLFFVVLFSLKTRRISMKPVFFFMQICSGSPRKSGQWAQGFWVPRKPPHWL